MSEVLMIDDDVKLGDLLTEYFAKHELVLIAVSDPKAGIDRLKNGVDVSVVILDLMMPEIDGFQACQIIRKFSDVPILMLTARGEVADRVVGLELGVDDYMAKPFDTRELVARVKALMRRSRQTGHPKCLKAEDLVLDLDGRNAKLNSVDLQLSTTEFDLLSLLMINAGRCLSRNQIMDELKGVDWDVYQRGIDIAISRLRHKLKDSAKHSKFLRTIWGEGYCFVHRVERTP